MFIQRNRLALAGSTASTDIAPVQVRHEIAILVFGFPLSLRIRVHGPLRHQCQFRQHRAVPLHEMLEGVRLGQLKIVRAVERVEPGVEEVFRPFALS